MRRLWVWRGKRIKPSDKNLVVRSAAGVLAPAFFGTMALLNIKTLLSIDWQHISLFSADLNRFANLNIPYLIFSALVAAAVSGGALWLIRKRCEDHIEQLFHRQLLARMVLDNGWYDSVTDSGGMLAQLGLSSGKEKIVWFPKIFYYAKNGYLHISVEVTMGSYQEQLSKLEKKLESGLYCELVSRELTNGFIEYTMLYDMIGNRISISDVKAENGRLRLMNDTWWEYDTLPHMLIAGGTGGGKSYFILTIIETLLRQPSVLYVLDPKNADLADLADVMPNVYHKKEDIVECVSQFCDDMLERSEAMKQMDNYVTGKNYAYLGLEPYFLIFDEFVAFMEMLNSKERDLVLTKLKQIVMLGRQAGFFIILACQRPDAKYLGDGIRDQFNFRVALGRMSELGYGMMFGETTKDFFFKNIKGRGYADSGMGVISEFYTPMVPSDHKFMQVIGDLVAARERGAAVCEDVPQDGIVSDEAAVPEETEEAAPAEAEMAMPAGEDLFEPPEEMMRGVLDDENSD